MHELFTTARLIRPVSNQSRAGSQGIHEKNQNRYNADTSVSCNESTKSSGDDTTLTNAVLVNIESQTPGRHREPTTPRELYQIARALAECPCWL